MISNALVSAFEYGLTLKFVHNIGGGGSGLANHFGESYTAPLHPSLFHVKHAFPKPSVACVPAFLLTPGKRHQPWCELAQAQRFGTGG